MVSSRIFVLKLLLAGLFGQALGNEPLIAQQDWLFPVYPDYTTTVTIGKTYHLQWDSNLKNWFSSWCAVCGDPSNVDLWVQTGHNDDSAYKIACKRKSYMRKRSVTVAKSYEQLGLTSTIR